MILTKGTVPLRNLTGFKNLSGFLVYLTIEEAVSKVRNSNPGTEPIENSRHNPEGADRNWVAGHHIGRWCNSSCGIHRSLAGNRSRVLAHQVAEMLGKQVLVQAVDTVRDKPWWVQSHSPSGRYCLQRREQPADNVSYCSKVIQPPPT